MERVNFSLLVLVRKSPNDPSLLSLLLRKSVEALELELRPGCIKDVLGWWRFIFLAQNAFVGPLETLLSKDVG